MNTSVSEPTFEHRTDSLGVGNPRTRISWRVKADPAWRQSGYEVEVIRGGEPTRTRVGSDDSVLQPWIGAPLASREAASVRIRVIGKDGSVSAWSPTANVETGLLSSDDWVAKAMGPSWSEDADTDRRPPLVRRDFLVSSPVSAARLYVTAHGLYEVEINGHRVGDDALSPGWTVYGDRLRYYTYDVTAHIREGANTIGAWLGDGWYRGRLGFGGGARNIYGSDIALIAQLELTHTNGSRTVVATDGSWTSAPSPILTSGLYDGETFDAQAYPIGWSSPGFDGSDWTAVTVADIDATTLVAPDGPPVRCTEELAPVDMRRLDSGAYLIDFGQNFSGRIHLTSHYGTSPVLRIRHAEVLQNGELYTRPLRLAAATDEYRSDGVSPIDWEPRFTIHGFRFAEVSGWTGPIEDLHIVGRVYHSDMERTGWFESSNPLVNRLHENVLWSMRSNFVDVPTDCPQRDERLGWTGDLQVFAPTASFLFDVSGFLESWLKDVAVEQLPDGTVPWYVPVIPGGEMWTPIRPGAVWGDVAVLTPWTVYERYGDVRVLEQQYDSAKAWVDLMDRRAGETHIWDSGFQLGDWLDPAAPPEDPADALTDRYLVATAYFAWSAEHLARSAGVLGRAEDARLYGELAAAVRSAFTERYAPGGHLVDDAQTAYSLAIHFGLLSDELTRDRAGDRLAQLVTKAGNRIATGFAGTPVISDALSETGHHDAAYALLLEEESPSWLYTVKQGGTTIWERWDSQRPDGSVNPGEMTSFNHYALGSVADWLHRVVAGLAPAAPGYREIHFAPRPGGGLTWAKATHLSPYGQITSSWILDGERFRFTVKLPTGTTGKIDLPGAERVFVGPGTHELEVPLKAFDRSPYLPSQWKVQNA